MYTKVINLLFFVCLLQAISIEASRIFGIGQRIVGDQLLLKDVLTSRPAGLNEQPSVSFKYEIAEPITYIKIGSEENILAEVKFSYTNQLIVGVVTGHNGNTTTTTTNTVTNSPSTTTSSSSSFDVSIMIFGFNETMLNVNPSLLINRDQHFEGELLTDFDDDDDEAVEDDDDDDVGFENVADNYEDDYKSNSLNFIDEEEAATNTDHRDKTIEIGHRQEGDTLIYETYQTSPESSKAPTNHSVIFYYIDSVYITYVKFVIFDHFATQQIKSNDYMAPVAEYSHYSNSTLKAIVTDYNTTSLFVQMFLYGYKAQEAPAGYEPFLPPPHWQRSKDKAKDSPLLTPMQRIQLALLLGKATTSAPEFASEDNNDDDDDKPQTISPEDMAFVNKGNYIVKDQTNAALPKMDLGFGALIGLFLLILHNMDN